MALNRESIERRDFPTARRGYDPAAVDAHLRALAVEVEALVQRTERAGEPALGTAAANQVQGILDAAQATAAEIERTARNDAQGIREEAAQDAERARAHVETLAQTTAALRERVVTLDGEVNALALSLRAVEGVPLASVPSSAATVSTAGAAAPPVAAPTPLEPAQLAPALPVTQPAPAQPAPTEPAPTQPAPAQPAPTQPAPAQPMPAQPTLAQPMAAQPASAPVPPPAGARGGNDLDGARLVALNMALNGESREQADRYLAESFELADREKLLDEVYAAIQG